MYEELRKILSDTKDDLSFIWKETIRDCKIVLSDACLEIKEIFRDTFQPDLD